MDVQAALSLMLAAVTAGEIVCPASVSTGGWLVSSVNPSQGSRLVVWLMDLHWIVSILQEIFSRRDVQVLGASEIVVLSVLSACWTL